METLQEIEPENFSTQSAIVETFQKFWFMLVYSGYLPNLSWPKHWIPFLYIIASASPALVKNRDHLQTATTPFSQILLSQGAHTHVKAHIQNTLLSGKTLSSTKNLNLAQCLWLLSFYYCELFKLSGRIQPHLYVYLESDVIPKLELYSFVEELSKKVISTNL